MRSDDNSFSRSGQSLALRWMEQSLARPGKASDIRAREDGDGPDGPENRRAQRLHADALRHLRLYRYLIDRHVRRAPPLPLQAILLLALAEISADGHAAVPAVVDSWTGLARQRGGKKSAGFANAVLRKLATDGEAVRSGKLDLPTGIRFSHPDWLIERWTHRWGADACRRLLEWNQQIPSVFAQGIVPPGSKGVADHLSPTRWPGFHRVDSFVEEVVQALRRGVLTIRDPATRIAVAAVLKSQPQSVLDLCASPGGKARGILSASPVSPQLTAVDLPHRMGLLSTNLEPWRASVTLQPADLETGEGLPASWAKRFDAVLLDSPCSNTGVLRRKPDAKWRLRPSDIDELPELQCTFLDRAAPFVRPGGFLVYGTCSLEEEENIGVVRRFLRSESGRCFSLQSAVQALPFKNAHDGAGVFRLERIR